jgi:hypothetical protein
MMESDDPDKQNLSPPKHHNDHFLCHFKVCRHNVHVFVPQSKKLKDPTQKT